MRVIYLTKGIQWLVALICLYNIISSTQICSYRPIVEENEILPVESTFHLVEGSGHLESSGEIKEETQKEMTLFGKGELADYIRAKGEKREEICVETEWTDIISKKYHVPLFNLWLACLILILLLIAFELELLYFHCTGKDQNKLTVGVVGLIHLILTGGILISLMIFRRNWHELWSEMAIFSTNPPVYPFQWLTAEIITWALLFCHLLEMIFYRFMRGDIFVGNQLDWYNVAERETEMTYISAYKPLVEL